MNWREISRQLQEWSFVFKLGALPGGLCTLHGGSCTFISGPVHLYLVGSCTFTWWAHAPLPGRPCTFTWGLVHLYLEARTPMPVARSPLPGHGTKCEQLFFSFAFPAQCPSQVLLRTLTCFPQFADTGTHAHELQLDQTKYDCKYSFTQRMLDSKFKHIVNIMIFIVSSCYIFRWKWCLCCYPESLSTPGKLNNMPATVLFY